MQPRLVILNLLLLVVIITLSVALRNLYKVQLSSQVQTPHSSKNICISNVDFSTQNNISEFLIRSTGLNHPQGVLLDIGDQRLLNLCRPSKNHFGDPFFIRFKDSKLNSILNNEDDLNPEETIARLKQFAQASMAAGIEPYILAQFDKTITGAEGLTILESLHTCGIKSLIIK